jgi:hypothetical protein
MRDITREFLDQIQREANIVLPAEYVGVHPRVALYGFVRRMPPHRKASQSVVEPVVTPTESALLALQHAEVEALLDGEFDIDATSTRIAEELGLDAEEVADTFRAFWFFYNEKQGIRIVNE